MQILGAIPPGFHLSLRSRQTGIADLATAFAGVPVAATVPIGLSVLHDLKLIRLLIVWRSKCAVSMSSSFREAQTECGIGLLGDWSIKAPKYIVFDDVNRISKFADLADASDLMLTMATAISANRQPRNSASTANRKPRNRQPLTANRQPPTANRQPPTANRQPPTAPWLAPANHSPPFAHPA